MIQYCRKKYITLLYVILVNVVATLACIHYLFVKEYFKAHRSRQPVLHLLDMNKSFIPRMEVSIERVASACSKTRTVTFFRQIITAGISNLL